MDDYYAANKANEYTTINRNSSGAAVSHDAAGNMTTLPVVPGAGASAGANVVASLTWDAFNRVRSASAGDNSTFAYCYDAFGRRIAQWDASTADNLQGRRYIWDGWSTIQEQRFANYLWREDPVSEEWIEVMPTEADAHSKVERVYVNGASIDEPLFVAIDGDLDGFLGTARAKFGRRSTGQSTLLVRSGSRLRSEGPPKLAERIGLKTCNTWKKVEGAI